MDNTKPDPGADILALAGERFSSLSSEIISLLENLKREVHRSEMELKDVQIAVDAGKRELEALCEIEKETSNLERQIEDLRRQKESLERLIADLQSNWEEAITRRVQEEQRYEENLKTLRQREEEEYRIRLQDEQKAARQKLEEEMDAARRENADARAEEEKGIRARESALDKKERELGLLMQELEKFLSGLTARIGTAGENDPSSKPGVGQREPRLFGFQDEFKGGFNPDNALMWDDAGEEPGA